MEDTRDEFYCPHVVAIIRLLMLTGCRLGEIVSLEWDWIKDKRIRLLVLAKERRELEGLEPMFEQDPGRLAHYAPADIRHR